MDLNMSYPVEPPIEHHHRRVRSDKLVQDDPFLDVETCVDLIGEQHRYTHLCWKRPKGDSGMLFIVLVAHARERHIEGCPM